MLNEYLKYPRWCPKCKTLHRALWKECTVCKSKLVSSLWRFPAWVFRTVCSLIFLAAVLASFCVATYFIQKSERKFYKQSYEYLKDGHYEESWDEFCKAFWYNPAARLARYGIDKIGEGIGGISESANHNTSVPETRPSRIENEHSQSPHRQSTENWGGILWGFIVSIAILGGGAWLFFILKDSKSSNHGSPVGQSFSAEPLKKYCRICQGVHQEGDVFCPKSKYADTTPGTNQNAASTEIKFFTKFFAVTALILTVLGGIYFIATGTGGLVEHTKSLVFAGSNKPIAELIREHPQVKSAEWFEDTIDGKQRAVCNIRLNVPRIAIHERETLGGLPLTKPIYFGGVLHVVFDEEYVNGIVSAQLFTMEGDELRMNTYDCLHVFLEKEKFEVQRFTISAAREHLEELERQKASRKAT